jgi:dTDP-4-amino-4,6-dideoxygalactose transaminase
MSLPTIQTAPFLPFALPDIGEDEIAEVVDTMRSGWLTTGPKTRQFEQEFAAFAGSDVEAMAVNSATAGLHLALEAAGVQSGDEVITTTYTFTATAEVVRYLDAHPVLADISPETLNIDPKAVERAVTPRTKAIIPVHFGGLACDMEAILSIAGRHGLKVIEDAAHAFPCVYRGTRIGALPSDAAVFSFYATKTLATGEGGMIVTRDPELARRCRVMRLHGIDRDAFNRYRSEKPAWFYSVIAPGFKYNMPDLAAAIGLHQLRRGLALQAQRQRMAERYDAAFADLPLLLPPKAPPGDLHAWHLYVIRLTDDAPVSRDAFIEQLAQRGIGASVHFIPLHLHPYWQETYRLRPEDFPCAQRVFERCVSLPLYTRMTEGDQARVIDAVREILRG